MAIPQVVSEGACPSCGAPVQFTVGTARIKVCEHCQTVVARVGEGLSATGKVAALAETATPFWLGLEGAHDGTRFRFVGHLQKDYGDGVWDEWYLAFEDGRFGWLSESEGALHLLFPRGEKDWERRNFAVGREAYFEGRRIVVEEIRTAELASAAGELPSDLEVGTTLAVDATGPGGVFITFDFGTREHRPEVFVGRRLRLEALGIRPEDLREAPKRKVQLQDARCTQCRGPLDLKAPDRLRRVACPYCGALMEAKGEKLSFLNSLPDLDHPLRLPLYSRGTLGGVEWVVIGYMLRSCTVDGTRYPWDEYLLWSPTEGFTFLMDSNGHWTHLVPVPAGEVRVHVEVAAYFKGKRYRAFQQVDAVTETVRGEFYWKVRAGEKAHATEYVLPPHSINADATKEEITYTHGTYLQPEEVEKAFGLKEPLPTPQGVAPSQPYPHAEKSRRKRWWLFGYTFAAIFLFVLLSAHAAREPIYASELVVGGRGTPAEPQFSRPFSIPRSANAVVKISIPGLSNEWAGVQVDLVDEAGEVRSVYKEVTYYSGVDSDGSWREGSRQSSTYISRIPKGTYSVRILVSNEGLNAPRTLNVSIISDVPRPIYLVLLLLVFGGMFAVDIMRRASFESTRWYESNLVEGE